MRLQAAHILARRLKQPNPYDLRPKARTLNPEPVLANGLEEMKLRFSSLAFGASVGYAAAAFGAAARQAFHSCQGQQSRLRPSSSQVCIRRAPAREFLIVGSEARLLDQPQVGI